MDDRGVLRSVFLDHVLEWAPGTPKAVIAEAESLLRAGTPIQEVVERFRQATYRFTRFERNVFLNEGIQRIWDLVIGAQTRLFNNTNARVGVGNSTTAAAATDTGLLGASTALKAMDATFPSRSGQEVTFRGTFGTADANFAWEEFTVDDGDVTPINLNRKVQAEGTKTSTQTRILEVKLSIA